jgi:SiaC family regulatory phosphoprotein
MQKLYFPQTPTSPEIIFSPEDRIFSLRGISIPEDVRELYYPVIEWFRQYIDTLIDGNSKYYSSVSPLKFQVDLEYFNSSSAKFLYDIFLELKRLMDARIPVVVEWYYNEEDVDLKEAGSEIALLAEMEFLYIAKTR